MEAQKLKSYLDILRVAQGLGFQPNRAKKIPCPFHQEQTPSCALFTRTQTFKCFGCGEQGDAISFYAKVRGLNFKDACEELADQYAPHLQNKDAARSRTAFKTPKGDIKPPSPIVLSAETIAPEPKLPVLDPAQRSAIYESFRQICLDLPANDLTQNAFRYLIRRGLTVETLKRFGLFVVKDYALINAELKRRHPLPSLQSAGLFSEKGNLIFYRHPIIIPYYANGQLVYLQGRTLDAPPPKVSKYQFLARYPTPLFNADALKTTPNGQTIYLTEGVFDALIIIQNGAPALALGSANNLKPEWVKLFKNHTVTFFLDNDRAGQAAVKTFAPLLHNAGVVVFQKVLPAGVKDVNEMFLLYQQAGGNTETQTKNTTDILSEHTGSPLPKNTLDDFIEINPHLQTLIDAFDLY